MSVEKIVAFGNEYELTVKREENYITNKDNIVSLLKDFDREMAERVNNAEVTIRVEKNIAMIYSNTPTLG